MAIRLGRICLVVAALAVAACGGDGGIPGDGDNDGFLTEDGDCDDSDRTVYPGAPEPCDGVDNDCDGEVDPGFDNDTDGYSSCGGDCRDNDPSSHPDGVEVIDGLDNDCDDIADNHTDQYDDDGDGYSEDNGDCDDSEGGVGELIGPDALEINETEEGEPEEIDNDCDGAVDEGELPCPTDLDPATPMGFAVAIDVCNEVRDAYFTFDDAPTDSRLVTDHFGDTYEPNVGPTFAILSSGYAADTERCPADYEREGFGTDGNFDTEHAHPDPQAAIGCSDADPTDINDYSDLELVLDVPANARSFSFDFNFMSAEFPEFVCTSYDDTFLALLQSQEFNGNVSFDENGNRVSINIGFFDICDDTLGATCTGEEDLIGTGYEMGSTDGGGTGWLTTTAPVRPGEKVRLTFLVFDEGDSAYDSTVLIDNFRWHVEQVEGPITVD